MIPGGLMMKQREYEQKRGGKTTVPGIVVDVYMTLLWTWPGSLFLNLNQCRARFFGPCWPWC